MNRGLIASVGLSLGSIACAGPDLICSEISGAVSYGFVDGKVAYSFGTTLCNVGDMPVSYTPTTNQHPLIVQSIYKLKDHRIEQIGIGFVRHTNIPLAGNACGLGCTPAGLDALGVGCSDTSSASINGVQSMMGPRTEVNAQTGVYPYPFTSMGQAGDAIYKRVQVELADVSDPDALYFVETQVIVPGELDASARNNNVSYRQVVFAPGSVNASLIGPTYDQQPAVFAWRDHGNGIGVPDDDVMVSSHITAGGGLLYALSRYTLLPGPENYRYDYVLYNQNSEREINYIAHSVGSYGDANSFEFQSPQYHSDLDGDSDSAEWTINLSVCDTNVERQPVSLNVVQPNTIRWGTAYRYSFTTQTWPDKDFSAFGITVSLSKPFNPDDEPWIQLPAHLPNSGEFCCKVDLNNDGAVNFFDVSLFLQDYNTGSDYNADGSTDFFDVSRFLQDYLAGCP